MNEELPHIDGGPARRTFADLAKSLLHDATDSCEDAAGPRQREKGHGHRGPVPRIDRGRLVAARRVVFKPFQMAGAREPGARTDVRVFGYRDDARAALAAAVSWKTRNPPANLAAFLYVHQLDMDTGRVRALIRTWKVAVTGNNRLRWIPVNGPFSSWWPRRPQRS